MTGNITEKIADTKIWIKAKSISFSSKDSQNAIICKTSSDEEYFIVFGGIFTAIKVVILV